MKIRKMGKLRRRKRKEKRGLTFELV